MLTAKLSNWHSRAVCPGCGWHVEAPFGELFYVHVDCCPKCGCDKDYTWKVKNMRCICVLRPNKTWWNPLTWGSIYTWETK